MRQPLLVVYFAYSLVFTVVLMWRGTLGESDPDVLARDFVSVLYLVQAFALVAVVATFCAFDCIGWSPGRLAVGIRIVRWDGGRPGLRHGPIRYAARTLSAVVLYLGFLWVFWDRHRQAWHDKMAQTYVVRVRSDFAFKRDVTDEVLARSSAYHPGPRGRLRRSLVSTVIAAVVILLLAGGGFAMNWSLRGDRVDLGGNTLPHSDRPRAAAAPVPPGHTHGDPAVRSP